MSGFINGMYRSLPIQLLFLHFRKYQLLLFFWVLLFGVITENLLKSFGAASLFLGPEYIGHINVYSYFIIGSATSIFTMGWHITTFIIHSDRIPFLGATRYSFWIYCINNSIIPILFYIVYTIQCIHFLNFSEHLSSVSITYCLGSFFLGSALFYFISFAYFFRVDRDVIKYGLMQIANPSIVRGIIPYDTLDNEVDVVRAKTYIGTGFKLQKINIPKNYNSRFLNTVLRRHHRNAVFAIILLIMLLFVLGFFINKPFLRIPAGASFLLLFNIIMSAVGAFKYFLRSWEFIGWITLTALLFFLTKNNIIDTQSQAIGLNYKKNKADYNYENLSKLFHPNQIKSDKNNEEKRLLKWKENTGRNKPPLIIISASGGGSRAAYWTFRTLQHIDSISEGKLFHYTTMITGASGGMIGASYWRNLHTTMPNNGYQYAFQEAIGKDFLNAIVFSLTTNDILLPFSKVKYGNEKYKIDRGYAFERELSLNTNKVLDGTISTFIDKENLGQTPLLIINGTIINDGRKLIVSSRPLSFLTQAGNQQYQTNKVIDAVDAQLLFKDQNIQQLSLNSALRISATFPIVLPIVQLPTNPTIQVMDAGLRDNYGTETLLRYATSLKKWIEENTSKIIFIQIRDTRSIAPAPFSNIENLITRVSAPLFSIQKKWSSFQTYQQTYGKDFLSAYSDNIPTHYFCFEYIPEEANQVAALNFHLTNREKNDIYFSIYREENQILIKQLIELMQ